jgi:hypothetical protein
MNAHGLVKSLDLPAGWTPPAELEYDDIRATAISRAHLQDDVQGINASIELIHRMRGAGRQSRSATISTTSIWSGTNSSSAKTRRSPTPCTTPAASWRQGDVP